MAVDLQNKRVIMIHGLASKPPAKALHELWRQCILENIRVDDAALAAGMEADSRLFRSAYWADATPHHIADDAAYVRKLREQIDGVIAARQEAGAEFHVGPGEAVGDFFKDRGADLVKLLAGALTVKDDVMRAYLRETELYALDQHIADRMRAPLEEALREAWDSNCEVVLLAHSMGTFISYDVLWRFSHRDIEGFKKYRAKKVRLFATMGSPLGDKTVRDLFFARHHKNQGRRQYPVNIEYWHNYSCLGDVVSHQPEFEKIFFEPMRGLGIISGAERTRDYVNLHNPFQVVAHAGNKGREMRNPHKSYGYLVQPRLSKQLSRFFRGELE